MTDTPWDESPEQPEPPFEGLKQQEKENRPSLVIRETGISRGEPDVRK